MATGGAGGGVSTDLKQIRETLTKLPNEGLRTALLTLIDEANGDLERARANIEEWYEGAMDRVSGWYKRRAGFTMLFLGIAVAAVTNADTINLALALARDSAVRAAVVSAAEQRLATGEANRAPEAAATTSEAREREATIALQRAYADVSSLGLPIGWRWSSPENRNDLRRVPDGGLGWLLKVIGILLTGFAISQGAPFWFDVLNRFMVIRSTVKPKEKSAEQPSKDRPAPKADIATEGDAQVGKN
jgi:hypothetical protein